MCSMTKHITHHIIKQILFMGMRVVWLVYTTRLNARMLFAHLIDFCWFYFNHFFIVFPVVIQLNQYLFSLWIGIAESKRPSSSFYAGSRYGRSQNTGPINSSLRVTPRRDFHFLRYGKRAIYHDENEITRKTYEPYRENSLICSYLGVRDYYRCWKG